VSELRLDGEPGADAADAPPALTPDDAILQDVVALSEADAEARLLARLDALDAESV
jgi:hypothetical protein